MHRQAARAKKALAAPAKKTLALTTVSLPQYLALFTAAGVSLLSGASVVHNILQPDLVRTPVVKVMTSLLRSCLRALTHNASASSGRGTTRYAHHMRHGENAPPD